MRFFFPKSTAGQCDAQAQQAEADGRLAGQTIRRAKAMQTHWNTAIEHNGFLYGSSGRHTGNAELRCIEWTTGKVRWSIPRLTRAS